MARIRDVIVSILSIIRRGHFEGDDGICETAGHEGELVIGQNRQLEETSEYLMKMNGVPKILLVKSVGKLTKVVITPRSGMTELNCKAFQSLF